MKCSVYEIIGEEEEWVADFADERIAIECVYYVLEGHFKGKYIIRTPAGKVVDHDLTEEIRHSVRGV